MFLFAWSWTCEGVQPLLSTMAAFHRIHSLANGFMHVQDTAGLARLSKAVHQWALDVHQSDYGYVLCSLGDSVWVGVSRLYHLPALWTLAILTGMFCRVRMLNVADNWTLQNYFSPAYTSHHECPATRHATRHGMDHCRV